ncbi:MAG: hypothetical protein AAFQ81_08345, partial [Pseudomonadota bacterium]
STPGSPSNYRPHDTPSLLDIMPPFLADRSHFRPSWRQCWTADVLSLALEAPEADHTASSALARNLHSFSPSAQADRDAWREPS